MLKSSDFIFLSNLLKDVLFVKHEEECILSWWDIWCVDTGGGLGSSYLLSIS